MDNYISKVKKTDFREKKAAVEVEETMAKENVEEFKEEEKEYLSGKKTVFQKFMDFIAGTEDESPEHASVAKPEESDDEKELEKYDNKNNKNRNSGLMNSVKGFFTSKEIEPVQETAEDKKRSLPEDIKEVLRIQNRWIAMLPGNTIREFKSSPDYTYYKDTLQKYGLIKTK